MVIVGPAIGFGAVAALIVIFAAGYLLTYGVLGAMAKQAARQSSRRLNAVSEDNTYKVAVVGGLIPVVVSILAFFNSPPESRSGVAALLTVLGFIVCGLSFVVPLLREDATSTPPRPAQTRYQPPNYSSPRSQTSSYQAPSYRPTPRPPAAAGDPYRDLLAKARYDKDVAERLIEYERKRAPRDSLDQLCRSAIDRLERDNR